MCGIAQEFLINNAINSSIEFYRSHICRPASKIYRLSLLLAGGRIFYFQCVRL